MVDRNINDNHFVGGDGFRANIAAEVGLANKALLNKSREVGSGSSSNDTNLAILRFIMP